MRFSTLKHVTVGLGRILAVGHLGLVRAAEPDWKAVEQALGKSGQLQPGASSASACPARTSRSR
jgi:hypothetical protein